MQRENKEMLGMKEVAKSVLNEFKMGVSCDFEMVEEMRMKVE